MILDNFIVASMGKYEQLIIIIVMEHSIVPIPALPVPGNEIVHNLYWSEYLL